MYGVKCDTSHFNTSNGILPSLHDRWLHCNLLYSRVNSPSLIPKIDIKCMVTIQLKLFLEIIIGNLI